MKHLILLLALVVAMGGILNATPITTPCTSTGARVDGPVSATTSYGPIAVNCPMFNALPGQSLSFFTLTAVQDYSVGNPTTSQAVQFTNTGVAAFLGLTSGVVSPLVTGGASSTSVNNVTVWTVAPANFGSVTGSTTFLAMNNSGSLTSGNILGGGSFGASFFVTYDTVPEPGTMLFMGGGLLALGIFGRRRMKA